MTRPYIQNSFHAGEWAPALNARVDLAKYKSAAALLENFFVDYRGGASSRSGTKYVIQCKDSVNEVRLISFQASFNVGYILEFGHQYIRFINDGAPVLESTKNILNVTQANPGVVTCNAHGYSTGDWVYITSVLGMSELNGRYFRVGVTTVNTYQLLDLNGVAVDTSAYGAYGGGGTNAKVYSISSPYHGHDLAILKFAQDVDQMVLTHPDYPPYVLRFASATSWTLSQISFGVGISPPTSVVATTTLAAGNVYYAYVVTAVDGNGEESVPSAAGTLSARLDLRTNPGTNRIFWGAVPGAISYNVYKTQVAYTAPVPSGAAFGYIGTSTGTIFDDSNIAPDFSQTPPVAQNPFSGAGVVSYTMGLAGGYTSVPAVTVAPSGGLTSATANAVLEVQGTPTVGAGGAGYAVNDIVYLGNGVAVVVNTEAAGVITSFKAITVAPSDPGAITAGATPTNPVAQVSTSGAGTGATVNLSWGVGHVVPISQGSGYTAPPAVTFTPAGATATAVLGPSADLNPSVAGYFQQRLVLAGLAGAPQTFYLSQPGAPFNFNISNPIQADNAISASLVSGQLNTIKSMVAMPSGLILLTDRASWLVNGGGGATDSAAVDPSNITANPHSYNGVSDVPPIVANFDILYVQAKGSIVRDLAYNIYTNVYTGTDISVLSSHLFYGYQILEWAWAEEPFKIVWAIRDDGTLLSLTFLKEQELIGWCHSITDGDFLSVAVSIEETDSGSVDAPYFVVERSVNGNTVKYIERLAERDLSTGLADAWFVDSGLKYDGPPASSFTGAEHLAGKTVTGLADGSVIAPFVMPTNGSFTLATAASKVVIGLAYTPKLQTLSLEVASDDGTVQGREKKIQAVTVRVQDTLGLSIGSTFDNLVPMKDLQLGNVGSATNQVVTGLVTADARTIIDPKWSVPGQYCITQPYPWPATILGVIPEIAIGEITR